MFNAPDTPLTLSLASKVKTAFNLVTSDAVELISLVLALISSTASDKPCTVLPVLGSTVNVQTLGVPETSIYGLLSSFASYQTELTGSVTAGAEFCLKILGFKPMAVVLLPIAVALVDAAEAFTAIPPSWLATHVFVQLTSFNK